MDFVSKISTWFQGKKTIIGGFLSIAAAAAGTWYGKIDPVTGLAVAGIGFSAIGLGDKANRHQAQILTAIQGAAQAGADFRAGNRAQAVADAQAAVIAIAAPLAIQGVQDLGAGAHATFHLSADSAGELATAMTSLGQTMVAAPASQTPAVTTAAKCTEA